MLRLLPVISPAPHVAAVSPARGAGLVPPNLLAEAVAGQHRRGPLQLAAGARDVSGCVPLVARTRRLETDPRLGADLLGDAVDGVEDGDRLAAADVVDRARPGAPDRGERRRHSRRDERAGSRRAAVAEDGHGPAG